jgi:hypothetical protein
MGVLAGVVHQFGFCLVSDGNSYMAGIFLALVSSELAGGHHPECMILLGRYLDIKGHYVLDSAAVSAADVPKGCATF